MAPPSQKTFLEIKITDNDVDIQIRGKGLDQKNIAELKSKIREAVRDFPIQTKGTIRLNLDDLDLANVRSALKDFEDFDNGSDRVVIGRRIEVKEQESVGDVVVIAGDARIRGQVKNLVVLGGRADIAKTARIKEDLVVIGGKVTKEEGVSIGRNMVDLDLDAAKVLAFALNQAGKGSWFLATRPLVIGGFVISQFFRWLFFFGLSFVLLKLFPRVWESSLTYLGDKAFGSLGWGILGTFLWIPGGLILALTIIGILFLPLYGFIALLAYLWGYGVGAYYLGQKLAIGWTNTQTRILFWGTFILAATGLVPVLGFLAVLVVTLLGFGALFKTTLQAFRT
ncbi:MAG: hypothetical protein HY401_01890 [Elusimicrobia bacterium]|nr:hypothetical protein [Elusimicrobiota bacterium]